MKKAIILFFFTLSANLCLTQEYKHPVDKEKLKYGIYRTYEEFKYNMPGITDFFFVQHKKRRTKNWEGTYSKTPRFTKNNKKVKQVWGYSDGKHVYIFHQIDFFRVEMDNERLGFWAYGKIDNSGAVAAGIVGGAIGAGLYSMSVTSNAKQQKVYYTINKYTGKVSSNPNNIDSENEPIPTTSKLVLYRRGKKESDVPFKISINDSLKCEFLPYSYQELTVGISKKPLQISYGDERNKYFEINIQSPKTTYIECSFLKNENVYHIKEVSTQTGEFWSAQAKNLQEKREKKAKKAGSS